MWDALYYFIVWFCSYLYMVSSIIKLNLSTFLYINCWWTRYIDQLWLKGWEIGKNSYRFCFSYSIVVDEDLYGIVCYDPLVVVVFNLFQIYICVDHVHEYKLMNIWAGDYDDTIWSSCLHSYCSCDLGCMAIV